MVEEFKKEKIDRFDMSGTGNGSANDVVQGSRELEKVVTESRACPDIHKNLSDLTSQVQMMSDSLAACKQMSKYRPLRKAYDVAAKTKPQPTPQTSGQELLPAQGGMTQSVEKDVIISYMTNKTNSKNKLKRWNGCASEESFSGSDLREPSDCGHHKKRFDAVSNSEENPKPPRKMAKTKMNKMKEIDPIRMVYVIQRELKTLKRLVPSVSLLSSELSDAIARYAGCTKCSKRVSSSLPWVLNRIQELIVYVAVKRRDTDINRWLQSSVEVEKSSATEEEEKELEEESAKSSLLDLTPLQSITEIGRSEKVDAIEALEAKLGVQILLEVKPEKRKKRFFLRANRSVYKRQESNYPIVEFEKPTSLPVVHVLKSSPEPEVNGSRKQEVFHPSGYSASFYTVFLFCSRFIISLLALTPVPKTCTSHIIEFQTAAFLNPEEPFEERVLQLNRNSFTILDTKTTSRERKPSSKEKQDVFVQSDSSDWKPIVKEKSSCRNSNDSKSFNIKNFLANAPAIVKDLLKEAEEEKMEIKKLDVELQVVKDLMLEVHRNQIELSRFLLENGIYTQPLIRLTDPNMLAKENEILRAIENSVTGNGNYSMESLKSHLRDVKEKCVLKNRIVLTLMKGLQSDVPKEWWEEIMVSTLDDTKPIEEFDSEKFTELVWRISHLPLNDEQASKKKQQTEEQPSEEEPNAKGKMGENVKQDLISVSYLDGNVSKTKDCTPDADLEGFLDCQPPLRFIALPVTDVPKNSNGFIRKLEDQISVLNSQNEQLWNEVRGLRNLLEASNKEPSNSIIREGLSKELKTPKKTINLTIQIVPDKLAGPSGNSGLLKIKEISSEDSQDSIGETTKSSPTLRYMDVETSSDLKNTGESSSNRKLTLLSTKPKFQFKSHRRRSQNDFSFALEDSPGTAANNSEEREKLQLISDAFGETSLQQHVMVAAPPPSGPILRFLSQTKAHDDSRAGPSKSIEYILQRPSLRELTEGQNSNACVKVTNERQLQPILENDDSSNSSGTVSQAIQLLRMRVRSIHKEVTVLKLKNDRIDKLLDRLLEDAAYSNRNLETMETNFNNFTNRLG